MVAGTINLTSDLDAISKQVSIQGNLTTTSAGKIPAITVSGNGQFRTSRITGPDVSISRLAIVGSSGNGVQITGPAATGARVQFNRIGTDASGTTAVPNSGSGVSIQGGATGALIGGVLGQDSNLISENATQGVQIQGAGSSNNVVQGNFIGTDATGIAALPNGQNGVFIAGANGNVIGSTNGNFNVISGNKLDGVGIQGPTATNNLVQGNYIGLNFVGDAPVANGENGVVINNGANGNTIGGTTSGARNVISGNNKLNISLSDTGTSGNVVQGNFIGTDVTGTLTAR